MVDNASNNDKVVRALADKQVSRKHHYTAQEHHLRCVGQFINLGVNAFWFGELDRMVLQDTVIVTRDTIAEWRKMGPWGKVHNITTYVLASHQRWQEFKRLGSDTMFHRGNATSWNTEYTMLQSIIRNRGAVDIFCVRHTEQLEEDRLSVDDWEQHADTACIMQPFHSATLRREGDFSKLHNILVEPGFLRVTFNSVAQTYPANPHLHICSVFTEGIVVLDKYLEWDNELTVCVAAVVVHPAYQWEYFKVAVDKLGWTENQLQDAKLRLQGLWLTMYMLVYLHLEGQRENANLILHHISKM
jgi:hypothetical protein